MKAYYLLAPLAVSLVGCTVYRPVAYDPVYTTPATVAVVSPTYVAPPNTVVMGAPAATWGQLDSDSDGYSNAVDRYPYDARWH